MIRYASLSYHIISISRNEIMHRIWPNPISNPIHGKPSFNIFEHMHDLIYTPIHFQIPILRPAMISISRNEITQRIWPNPISNPIHGNPSFDIFEHMHDLRYTQIQFQIPILRLAIISMSRNEISPRIWPNPISNPIHGNPCFGIFEDRQDLRYTPIQY